VLPEPLRRAASMRQSRPLQSHRLEVLRPLSEQPGKPK